MQGETKDSEIDPLTRANVSNLSEKPGTTTVLDNDLKSSKRKKFLKYGIFGAIGLIALILIIVLPIVLTRSGGSGGDPDKPIPPGGGNPYIVDPTKIIDNQVSV